MQARGFTVRWLQRTIVPLILWAAAGGCWAQASKDADPLPVHQVAAGVWVHFGVLE